MPNHVSHNVTVTGDPDQLASFIEAVGLDKEEAAFDFNAAVPRPEIYEHIQSGSDTDLGLAYFGYYKDKNSYTLEDYLDFPWVKEMKVTTVEQLKAWIKKDKQEAIKMGQLAIKAYGHHGYWDWYDWCRAKWGTKWNSYSVDLDAHDGTELRFTFSTAWGIAEPVYNKFGELYPDLEFTYKYIDEGQGFGGTYYVHGDNISDDPADNIAAFARNEFGWDLYCNDCDEEMTTFMKDLDGTNQEEVYGCPKCEEVV